MTKTIIQTAQISINAINVILMPKISPAEAANKVEIILTSNTMLWQYSTKPKILQVFFRNN